MNVFELFAKIGLDDSEYKSGLSKAADMGKNVIGGIGNIAKVGMGVATAAIGAGTAAMGAFGKSALDSYANYEQLAGGVEKLYGTAADKLKQYAQDGYKTAGMSANQYMETATSFSAALIKSLGGDVDKAADMTDKAMQAMSDNVNVFGSDMGSVQNAFQGFAKQNYTMLDNLKLGYGGTKEEMQKLIDDANEYRATIGETADLSIDSFADIVTAIDSIQEKQKIAGTTAKEAMTTIEGAGNMTKAAWENVITAIGRGEGLQDAMSGLKDAIFGIGLTDDGKETGLLNQIIPRIETIMNGAGDFIVQSAPLISEKLPELVDAVLPSLLEGGIALTGAVGQGILNALPSLWTTATDAMSTVGDYVYKGMDKAAKATENVDFTTPLNTALDKVDEFLNGEKTQTFIDNCVTLVTNIATGIGQAAPDVLPKAAEIVTNFIQGIEDNIPQILDAGADMAIGLAVGLAKALPKLWLEIQNMKLKVLMYIGEHVAAFISKGVEGVTNLISKVAAKLPQLPEKIAYYAGYAVTKFDLFFSELPTKAWNTLVKVVEKVIQWKKDFPKHAQDAADDFGKKLKEGIDNIVKNIYEWGKSIGEKFVAGIKAALDFAGDIFGAFAKGANDAQQQHAQQQKQLLDSGSPLFSDVEGVNPFDEGEKGINYETLAEFIVKAFVDADIKIEMDNREFGRLVRKVVTT